MIYTITLNPAVDKALMVEHMEKGNLNRALGSYSIVSGKGINVSKFLKALGIESTAMGFLGEKNAGMFLKYLKASGINADFHIVRGETRTNIKIVENGTGTVTEINEKGFEVSSKDIDELMARITLAFREGDTAVLSGSIPGGAPSCIYRDMINTLKSMGVRVILDGSGEALVHGLEGVPYAVKPNIYELKNVMDVDEKDINSVLCGGKHLLNMGIKKVLVSMGPGGAIYISENCCLHAWPVDVRVKNTVGAGDSMVAALARGIEQELPDEDIFRLSMACAAAGIMSEGFKLPSYEDIKGLVDKVKIVVLH